MDEHNNWMNQQIVFSMAEYSEKEADIMKASGNIKIYGNDDFG